MTEMDKHALLAEFAKCESELAFAKIVSEHVNLVYSTALRATGNPHHAEEITQAVFVLLARKAGTFPPDVVVSGWLYQTARLTAANFLKRERRRQHREQEAYMQSTLNESDAAAWEQIAPLLDDAMGHLGETDRTAVLLRFFENKTAAEVAATLNTTEAAAHKRVSRAVERMREFFAKRGVTVGAGGLAVVISANAVQAAPVGLAAVISPAALTVGTLIATTTITTQTTMNWITAKSLSAIVAAAVVAGTGTYLVQQHTIEQLRSENQKLAAAQQTLTKERDDALGTAVANADELKRRETDKAELMRLRGEVSQLRRQAKDNGDLAEQNRQLREAFNALAQKAGPPANEPEADPEKRFAIERLNQSKQLVLGLLMYAGDNADMLPTDLNSISNYFGNAASELLQNHPFELVLQGSLTNVPNPSTTIAVRSKSSFPMNGKSVKVYGFADGHAELKREPQEGFEAWEKERIFVPTAR